MHSSLNWRHPRCSRLPTLLASFSMQNLVFQDERKPHTNLPSVDTCARAINIFITCPNPGLGTPFRDDFMFSYAAKVLHNLSKASFRDTKACSTLRCVSVLAEIVKDASSPFLHALRSKSRGKSMEKLTILIPKCRCQIFISHLN